MYGKTIHLLIESNQCSLSYENDYLFSNSNMTTCSGLLKIRLFGGIGNQIFQFANGLNLSLENDIPINFVSSTPVCIDGMFQFELDKTYEFKGNKLVEVEKSYHAQCKFLEFFEESGSYSAINLESKHIEIQGYFQSRKYFFQVEPYLFKKLRAFSIPKESTRNIAIHIRLGDYLNWRNRRIYCKLNTDYFLKGLELLNSISNLGRTKVLIFTNDKNRFEKLYSEKFIDFQTELITDDPVISFKQMLSIENFVISNSTFSWWAAAASESKTIAPLNWYTKKSNLTFDPVNFQFPNWYRI